MSGQTSTIQIPHVEVATLDDVDNYPVGLRKWGMLITVTSEPTASANGTYELKKGLASDDKSDNDNWRKIPVGSGVHFDLYTDVSNVGATETSLHLDTILQNALGTIGDKFLIEYAGDFSADVANRQLRAYFDNVEIFDSGVLGASQGQGWNLNILITRSGADSARVTASILISGNSLCVITDIPGLDFTDTIDFEITGESTTDDYITLRHGYGQFKISA